MPGVEVAQSFSNSDDLFVAAASLVQAQDAPHTSSQLPPAFAVPSKRLE